MRLEISQQQKLTIYPSVMQTVELLALPMTDLAEKLEEEASENPVIELDYKKEKSESNHEIDEEIENKFQDSSDIGYEKSTKKSKSTSDFDSQSYIENLSVEDMTLQNHLLEQLHFIKLKPQEKEIAEIIITSLDDSGFLSIDLKELADNTQYSMDQIEKVRKIIQQLDPLGVASVSLQDFLKTQVEHEYGTNSIEYHILDKHINLIEKKLYTKLAVAENVEYEEIVEAVENIKHLHVLPAVNFTNKITKYIIPDAKVEVKKDKIEITLNDEYIPNVKLNQYYIELYTNSAEKETRSFLKKNIEDGKMLIENLKSRKEIIFKVIMCILQRQKDYFLKGDKYQVPLKLKDIADELNIHESTVSRAIKDKYIQTEKGIINLKSFFSTQVGTEETSANYIKATLKEIIEAEDKNSPLSDDKIVGILKNKGIFISRRTVAKYRSEMNIQPAYIRRNPL